MVSLTDWTAHEDRQDLVIPDSQIKYDSLILVRVSRTLTLV